MLYRNQKSTANAIGILAGLVLVACLVISHAPSTKAIPRMGADVKIDAWLGGSVRPEPISPTPFIRDKNLTAGASAASGILVLRSENGETEQIRLGLDANSIKDLADQTYARSVTINFGENGSLGSSTLEQLAEHPISPFAINPGATMRIPVAVTIPLSSGDAVAGQKIHVTIVPEQVR